VIRLPEINADAANADLVCNFGGGQAALDPRVTQVASKI
jgi:hypothetical protein